MVDAHDPPTRTETDRDTDARDPAALTDGGTDELAHLRARAQETLPPTEAEQLARLAEAAYRRAPGEALERLRADPDSALAVLRDALAFMEARGTERLALRTRDQREGTVVEICTDDTPFLVSTVSEELARLGERPAELLHPVVGVQRDAEGRLVALHRARHARHRESYMRLRLQRRLDAGERATVERELARVLADARAATEDFEVMVARAEEVADDLERLDSAADRSEPAAEVAALLRWLLPDHFVWLGARDYRLVRTPDDRDALMVEHGSGLGLLRDDSHSSFAEPVPLDELPEQVALGISGDQLLTVARTNRPSSVYKRVRMISLAIKWLDEDGATLGERRFIGMFAQRAFSQPASSIPVARRKLTQILEAEDVVPHSHDERALRALFEALPKHELLATPAGELRRTLVAMLEAQRRQHVALWWQVEPGGRAVVVLLSVPRERFNAELRQRVQEVLEAHFGVSEVDYQLSLSEAGAAVLHFVVHVGPERVEDLDRSRLEREVVAVTRTWEDAVTAALAERGRDGSQLAVRWVGAFDEVYQAATDPAEAVADIEVLEAVRRGSDALRLRWVVHDDARTPVRVRLVTRGPDVELGDLVPILETLGLVVVEQVPHRITVDEQTLQLHDVGVRGEGGRTIDLAEHAERLTAAVTALWSGRAEADLLNRLILDVGLSWQDVAVLRAYRRYRRQVGTAFTEAYLDEAIVSHPDVARALVRLFRARVDQRVPGDEDALAAVREELAAALEEVAQLDRDRILRRIAGSIEATVRSNVAVAQDSDRGSDALALKIDPARVPDQPAPVPAIEVFVHHATMEGIHLRGGAVARGGVRASDRREDFRSEVLGLMKAQMTKNALIVPAGAKGGFVLRRPPADPTARQQATASAYGRYVRALLDITDTITDGAIVAPSQVRRRDGDDPYLVVAPDKGTAALSDSANAIARQYGFWLDDAFASGGATGYDHKELGVTARSAWVAVQRHFRELGVDVQHEPISVVGIGDMSGDVFGNGMLRSQAVRLVAAFDHRHIVFDPDPDPEASFAERQRLFALPRSSWDDLDRSVLSAGGGVWRRDAKRIVLTEPMRAALGVDATALTPPELIRAILTMSCDLLFCGGIGTFVKGSGESHSEVADRANDAIRVDGTQLRARVVAEGANLAVTQRARVEYARRGGRINTDAIDNVGGVGTSDREVNLKVALRSAIARGELDPAERDGVLSESTEEVVAGVMADVDQQVGGVSREVAPSARDLDAYAELMGRLEHHSEGPAPAGTLDRELEVLPADAELRRRQDSGAGLTRPEIAVLLAYAKLDLRSDLLDADLPDDPALARELWDYFPTAAAQRAPRALADYRLRRELIATRVASEVLDRMGVTWVDRTARQTGREPDRVVAAYRVARDLLDAPSLWAALDANELVWEPLLVDELRQDVEQALQRTARTALRLGVEGIAEACDRDRPVVEAIASADRLGSERACDAVAERIARLVDLGVEPELARHLSFLDRLAVAPEVGHVARRLGVDAQPAADVYLRLGEELGFAHLEELLEAQRPQGRWQRWQRRGLHDELRHTQGMVTERVLRERPGAGPAEAVAGFLADHAHGHARVLEVSREMERGEETSLSALAVVVRTLREELADG